MTEIVIVDLTKTFPGATDRAALAVKDFCTANAISPSNLTVIARADQSSAQFVLPMGFTWVAALDVADGLVQVARHLQQLAGLTASVTLLSFNPDVWKLAHRPWQGLIVRGLHLFGAAGLSHNQNQRVSSSVQPVTIEGPEPPWTFDHLCSADDAVDTLVRVLRDRGAFSRETALRQTMLRPWMGMMNPAVFAGNAASTRSGGMISALLRTAAVRKKVGLGGSNPADFFVWLSDMDADRSARSAEKAQDVVLTPSEVVRPTEALPSPARPARKVKAQRQPDVFVTHRMSASIEQQRMGPFAMARPFVFEAISQLVSSNPNSSFRQLLDASLQKAKSAMAERGLPDQPWPAILRVTERQLLRAGVLLASDGKPLPNSWQSGRCQVFALAPNWVTRVEGEILLALFSVQDVTGSQLADIARSLYGSASPDAINQVQEVVEYLMKVPLLDEDTSGVFRVKRASHAESAPSTSTRPAQSTVATEAESDGERTH
jgi:hypothetical protein